MKKYGLALLTLLFVSFVSCSSSKSTKNTPTDTEQVSEENKKQLPLFNQIIRLPGITGNGGVPLFNSTNNSFEGATEPLYVLNGRVIGNSFASIDQVVSPVDVKKIKSIKGADASFYGSRGSNGVILITTK